MVENMKCVTSSDQELTVEERNLGCVGGSSVTAMLEVAL